MIISSSLSLEEGVVDQKQSGIITAYRIIKEKSFPLARSER
jgi:hypothetical protein